MNDYREWPPYVYIDGEIFYIIVNRFHKGATHTSGEVGYYRRGIPLNVWYSDIKKLTLEEAIRYFLKYEVPEFEKNAIENTSQTKEVAYKIQNSR